jgi:hypothetical protein
METGGKGSALSQTATQPHACWPGPHLGAIRAKNGRLLAEKHGETVISRRVLVRKRCVLTNKRRVLVRKHHVLTNTRLVLTNTRHVLTNTRLVLTNTRLVLTNTRRVLTNTRRVLTNTRRVLTNTRREIAVASRKSPPFSTKMDGNWTVGTGCAVKIKPPAKTCSHWASGMVSFTSNPAVGVPGGLA